MDRKWRALLIVCVAIFMLLLDITVVNVALPDIQKELNTSFTDLQWVVDAYALMLATVMLNAGTLGDWLGRKRVFIGGVILFTLASILCGSATSPLFLNLARGVQGIGGAIMFAVSLAIIAQEFHGRERGTAFGIWGATIGAAVAIGPLVGGVLTEYAGWRWIFFVNVPIGVVCVLGALRELHESRDEQHAGVRPARLPHLSPAASSRSSSRFCAATTGAGQRPRDRPPRRAVVAARGVRLPGVPQRRADLRRPPLPGRRSPARRSSPSRSRPRCSRSSSTSPSTCRTSSGCSPARDRRALPASLARSFLMAPLAAGCVAHPGALLFGVGLALVGVALLLMHGVQVDSSWTTLLAGFIVGGIGIGCVNAPLAATAVGVVAPRRAGMASGINNTFRQVGIATGIAGLGAIVRSRQPGRGERLCSTNSSTA